MLDLQLVWQQFLSMVQDEAGSRVVETWLKAVQFLKWDASSNTAYLKAPNKFVCDWISKHYISLIKEHLSRLLNVENIEINLDFLHEKNFSKSLNSSNTTINQTPLKTELILSKPISSVAKPLKKNSGLSVVDSNTQNFESFVPNPAYLFSTYVVGSSNALTHAASLAVAEQPGSLYNPLFIYGNSGLGKTHLLHAIANKVIKEKPNCKVVYQTADRFVNEFIQAIRFDRVLSFREQYKDVDILLIDDIQFICNKDQTQEAFFHIFNALYDKQKQIVFTCDKYPRDLSGLADRLKTRMEWGLITDLQMPPLETRIAILRKKADFHNISLTNELAEYIAQNISGSVRELEGTLIRIIAFSTLTHEPINFTLVDRILLRSNKANKARDPSISDVLEHYLNKNGITIDALRSKDRNKELVRLRHIAMYLAKKYTQKSLTEIAMFFGRKDHTTVIHAIEKIEQESKLDTELAQILQASEKKLSQFIDFEI